MTRFLAALIFLLSGVAAAAQEKVVLVASDQSPIEMISAFEVRKVFLGIDVYDKTRLIRGLRNLSDPRLNEIFLQTVVGLSEERYQRRLLSNVFKYGTARLEEYRDAAALTEALKTNPYAISYMRVDGEVPSGVKVLRVLWQEY